MAQDPPHAPHVSVNRAQWDARAGDWVASGEQAWAGEPSWGMWNVPEADLGLLPPSLDGVRSVELGCGTGYVSAWLARRGARAIGLDASGAQLDTARRLDAEHGTGISWVHGDAERTPFPDAAFDLVVSEYGAAIWCDPHVWIPEAHRLLRPGGTCLFLGTSTLATVCSPLDGTLPVTDRLERDYFSLYRLDWTDAVDDPGGIEFNLPISGWFRLFAATGFDVTGFWELQAPEPGPEMRHFASADWSHRFPSEQVWRLRKR